MQAALILIADWFDGGATPNWELHTKGRASPPEKVWYIIPAHRVTGSKGTSQITLCQFAGVRNRPKYEDYREAWGLLGKDREELARL